jgi:hypothetical protein
VRFSDLIAMVQFLELFEAAPPGLKALNLYTGAIPRVETRSPGLKSGAGTTQTVRRLPPVDSQVRNL